MLSDVTAHSARVPSDEGARPFPRRSSTAASVPAAVANPTAAQPVQSAILFALAASGRITVAHIAERTSPCTVTVALTEHTRSSAAHKAPRTRHQWCVPAKFASARVG